MATKNEKSDIDYMVDMDDILQLLETNYGWFENPKEVEKFDIDLNGDQLGSSLISMRIIRPEFVDSNYIVAE